MKAILWDGQKQLNGELIIDQKRIKFIFSDFANTDIVFDLRYDRIKEVRYYKIYGLPTVGLAIETMDRNTNVFIVEKPEEVKTIIEQCKTQVK